MSEPIPFPVRTDSRAERSELVALLVGAVVLLEESKDPIGRAYREHVIGRIRGVIDRENRS